MRLLYFNYLYDLRGASIGSVIKPLKLFSGMERLGHTVKLCWMRDRLTESEADAPSASRRSRSPLLRRFFHDPKILYENIRFLGEERRQITAFHPDLLISRLDLYLFSAMRNAASSGLPLVLEADCPAVYEARTFQPDYWHPPLLAECIERKVVQAADHIVTQSLPLKHYLASQYGVGDDKIDVVSNGADIVADLPEERIRRVREQYGLQDKIVAGFIGSMSAWHGIENLLNIFSAVIPQHPSLHFFLVGQGGDARRSVEKYIAEKSLADRITLQGYVPNEQIPELLAVMDIVLAPYPQMPFFYFSPVKIFEYMAAAKPVVSTRIGQIAELIHSGENGLLCDSGQGPDLAEAVIALARNPEWRRRLGQQARATIAAAHTWEHKAKAWQEICSSVLQKHSRRRQAQTRR
ncbi:MAG TPA: glycosyltransferase family 4 protein [bacterium]|nr:glycosyltransferase family 4 protein [bacterium]